MLSCEMYLILAFNIIFLHYVFALYDFLGLDYVLYYLLWTLNSFADFKHAMSLIRFILAKSDLH
jgi:hypothetical protein